jgi:hypothetical protein
VINLGESHLCMRRRFKVWVEAELEIGLRHENLKGSSTCAIYFAKIPPFDLQQSQKLLSLASWDSVAQGTKESIPYLAFAQEISL